MIEENSTSVTMLVGKHYDDIDEDRDGAFIAGCIDNGTLDVMGADEADAWFAEMKLKYDLGGGIAIAWREVRVTLNTRDLNALFDTGTLHGEINES